MPQNHSDAPDSKQSHRFKEAGREHECGEDEAAFVERVHRVAQPKTRQDRKASDD